MPSSEVIGDHDVSSEQVRSDLKIENPDAVGQSRQTDQMPRGCETSARQAVCLVRRS